MKIATSITSLLVTVCTVSASNGWTVTGFTGLNCNRDGPLSIGQTGSGCFNTDSKSAIKSLQVEDLGDYKITLYDGENCDGNKWDYDAGGCLKGHFIHPDKYADIRSWKIHS